MTFGKQLIVALLSALLVSWICPEVAQRAIFLGKAFLLFLEWFAPIVVSCTVFVAIFGIESRQDTGVGRVLLLYFCSMCASSLVTVAIGLNWPVELLLPTNLQLSQITAKSHFFHGLLLIALIAASLFGFYKEKWHAFRPKLNASLQTLHTIESLKDERTSFKLDGFSFSREQ